MSAPRKRNQSYGKRPNKPTSVTPVVEAPVYVRDTVTHIDVGAQVGRTDLSVGDRVRILGTGLYAGEIAVIESFATTALVPSAVVRTEAGRTRRCRTVDLEPVE